MSAPSSVVNAGFRMLPYRSDAGRESQVHVSRRQHVEPARTADLDLPVAGVDVEDQVAAGGDDGRVIGPHVLRAQRDIAHVATRSNAREFRHQEIHSEDIAAGTDERRQVILRMTRTQGTAVQRLDERLLRGERQHRRDFRARRIGHCERAVGFR